MAERYLHNSPDIYAEYTSWTTAAAIYTHDPIIRISGTTAQYYHQDGLGSVIAMSTNQDTTTVTQRFDAWGNVIASSGTIPQYGYTGREPDGPALSGAEGTGLVYYRARYYDPELGVFTQRNPIGLPGQVQNNGYVGDRSVPATKGYLDINISFWGVTGGLLFDDDKGFHPYLGYGLVTPGVSVTASPTSGISTGWNIGFQGSYIAADQIGITENDDLSTYGEVGLGTPGAALSRYYVFKKQYLPIKPAVCHKHRI